MIFCKTTGKSYVGQTFNTPEERFNGHTRGHLSVDKDIKKFGRQDFELSVLEEVIYNEEPKMFENFLRLLLSREVYWIRDLDTVNQGYNENEGCVEEAHIQKYVDQIMKARTLRCSECGWAYSSQDALDNHTGSDDRHVCKFARCQRRFKTLEEVRNMFLQLRTS